MMSDNKVKMKSNKMRSDFNWQNCKEIVGSVACRVEDAFPLLSTCK